MSNERRRTNAGVTRRQVVGGALGVAGLRAAGGIGALSALAACGGGGGSGRPVVTFSQPQELRSVSGTLNYPLSIVDATNSVGTATAKGVVNFRSRTYNGLLSGATLRVKAGDTLTIPISNALPANVGPIPPDQNTPHHFNSTNMHTHGFHVSPGEDNVYVEIHPSQNFTYTYHIPHDHPAGTMWYHPHKHGSTAMQLMSGMSGVIIVEGDASNGDLKSVPQLSLADEVVFNVNELNLMGLSLPPQLNPYLVPEYVTPSPFARGDTVFVVNGQFRPRLGVAPGQVVRVRMLNSSARNTLPISIEGNDMYLCALDGITIPNMRTVSEITLAPANRADVLIKISTPGTYEIRKGPFTAGGGAPVPADILAYIDVAGTPYDMPLPAGPLPVPTSLPDIAPAEVTELRPLIYNVNMPAGGPLIGGTAAPNFTINGVRFDAGVINEMINIGAVIQWTLTNPSSVWHPHHIHIHPFQVVATSDGMLNGIPLLGPTWADTVNIPPMGSVTLRQRFPDNPGLFVIHCHILVHEDIGMMQNVMLA
jgi:FtsP/CotA-like multicopper oxidase with cupredoxin domain